MFVWRKRASATWLAANEVALREIAGQRLAIVSRPALRNTIAEIASSNCDELEKIQKAFGGVIEKLPHDWLKTSLRVGAPKPLRIGKRLLITSSGRSSSRSLIIPAGAAFGTGEHATTIMSLRLLESLIRGAHSSAACPRNALSEEVSPRSRKSEPDWRVQASSLRSPEIGFSLLDVGTGSGILALAGARLGANRIIAIDNDPTAIATAKENARRNKIETVDFRVVDARQWKFPARIDVIAANLFSELLIKILPKMKGAEWLILSGVLRQQECKLVHALEENRIAVVETRRSGKWVAFLARHAERHSRDPASKSLR